LLAKSKFPANQLNACGGKYANLFLFQSSKIQPLTQTPFKLLFTHLPPTIPTIWGSFELSPDVDKRQSSPLMLEVLDPKEQCAGCGLVQFLILGMLL
jgi:hypothetical protein